MGRQQGQYTTGRTHRGEGRHRTLPAQACLRPDAPVLALRARQSGACAGLFVWRRMPRASRPGREPPSSPIRPPGRCSTLVGTGQRDRQAHVPPSSAAGRCAVRPTTHRNVPARRSSTPSPGAGAMLRSCEQWHWLRCAGGSASALAAPVARGVLPRAATSSRPSCA